ncbi:MAG: hypothetical protein AAF368_11495 [Planctomycetota bacterium]
MTEEDGSFVLHGKRPGPATFFATYKDLARVEIPIQLIAGEELDLGTIPMHAPVTISGWIEELPTPEEGKLLVSVHKIGDPRSNSRGSYGFSARGPFEITGLSPHEYVVQIRNTANVVGVRTAYVSAPQLVDATQGSVGEVRLTPVKATTVTLEFAHIRERPFPTVVARTSDGLTAESRSIYGSSSSLCLLPGNYRLEVDVPGEETRSRDLVVGTESQTLRLDLE